MAADDKVEHKGEELRGGAKSTVGKAVGDDRLERQGENDKTSAKMKQAGDKVKDAADDVKDRMTGDDKA